MMTNQQNSSQLVILETQLVEVEEQLNAPSLLRQQRAAKLRELERESQEKELAATNAARRYEDLASANLKLNAAMAQQKGFKFLQFNHVRQQQIDSLKKAISHHKLACEEAQRRYDRLKLKVRDLSDAVQKIDIRISLGETQDRIALKRQRDQIQAQIAKLADRKLENELNPRREILKKGKQALDWMVDLEIDDDR